MTDTVTYNNIKYEKNELQQWHNAETGERATLEVEKTLEGFLRLRRIIKTTEKGKMDEERIAFQKRLCEAIEKAGAQPIILPDPDSIE